MPAKRNVKKKTAPPAKTKGEPKGSAKGTAAQSACPIVGIGGSAGGFEAAMALLEHLSPKTGSAFAIVQHLDPHHASRLASLLGRVTNMPVIEVTKTITPEPNTVYVQPPNKSLICKDGALAIVRPTGARNLAIDHFFESLAESRGSRALGVILSGTGTDGTAGMRAIKAAGGLTFAQNEESAKFDAMPRSAIRAGSVDAVLPPREIARAIRRIADHPYIRRPFTDGAETERAHYPQADDLGRIFF